MVQMQQKHNMTLFVTILLFILVVLVTNLSFLPMLRVQVIGTDESPLLRNQGLTRSDRISPFEMPIRGPKYEIKQPLYDRNPAQSPPILEGPLLAPAENFISYFQNRIDWVNTLIDDQDKALIDVDDYAVSNQFTHAQHMYLEMIKSFVSATVFNEAEKSVLPRTSVPKNRAVKFDHSKRETGNDWTYSGDTMTGWKRLDNIAELLKKVTKEKIPGDYIETGVWRGGASVYARAVMNVLMKEDDPVTHRASYVCDSFSGLPPGDRKLDKGDKNWDHTPYLEIPEDVAINNFAKYGLLDSNVVFAKGFFNETMPVLSKKIKSLSIMRLDGDMYESTVDVLYHLYDKLSVGGYVIMDDWFNFPSKIACEDFFKVHGINPTIVPIDNLSAYWKKEEQVEIQYWRYKELKFK